jgi:hypothetical protein
LHVRSTEVDTDHDHVLRNACDPHAILMVPSVQRHSFKSDEATLSTHKG